MVLVDPETGYYLPAFATFDSFLVCPCDMCFSETEPRRSIGPHDLHCVCLDCCVFALDDDAYNEALEARYPDVFRSLVKDLGGKSIPYPTPPNSPTNKEMHAYNGNQFQHHHGVGEYLRAAARGIQRSTNPADQFAAMGVGWPIALASALSYTAHSNMSKPLAELRDQIFGSKLKHDPNAWQKKITNAEMHATNGNIKPQSTFDAVGGADSKQLADQWNQADLVIGKDYDFKNKRNKTRNIAQEIRDGLEITKNRFRDTAPSNKEMHAMNGNIYGPMNKGANPKTHKNQLKKLARKINKQKKKPKVVEKVFKKTIAKKKQPKALRRAAREFSKEQKIARIYASFLKQPVWKPPQLGSTGVVPTKLLHGFYETTVSMAAIGGTFGSLTNCTDMMAFISPKMFSYSTAQNNYGAPIAVGFAVNATSSYTNIASTSSITTLDFANVTALKNETGCATSISAIPLIRYLGGHISLKCRCPMSTTAPPYIFGGLYPSQNGATSGTLVDPALQLNQLSSTSLRALQSTREVEGFEVSTVYLPGSTNDLEFSTSIGNYSVASLINTPVAYVGMTGCPTTASVTIICSMWFEVQQNSSNSNYSGFSRGPKISTEDIFDYLPNIQPVQPVCLNQGTKNNGGSTSVTSVAELIRPPEKSLAQQLDELKIHLNSLNEKYQKLTVLTEEEDEKYITAETPDTPQYRSLSRSTIDLALQLKDRLTPGSVASKTSRISLP